MGIIETFNRWRVPIFIGCGVLISLSAVLVLLGLAEVGPNTVSGATIGALGVFYIFEGMRMKETK